MGRKTIAFANQVLTNALLDGRVHVGLGVKAGTEVKEVSYPGYERRPVEKWVISEGAAANVSHVRLPEFSEQRVERISHVLLFDSSGLRIYEMPLSSELSLSIGVVPVFEDGDIEVIEK